ncbi:MAG: NAD(P)H-hydrate epimerase, partial [Lentisphaeria bacterium]
MKVISVQTMRDLDRRTIEQGTPGKVLMERAGRGVFREIKQFLKRLHGNHCQQVVVFAGKGNNGGDAFVVAGLLAEETPLPVKVYAMAPKKDLPGDAREFAEKLPGKVSYSVIKTKRPENLLNAGDFVVDGLLGTGISGPLKAPYDTLIKYINTSRCPVVSIDIPSGLNGDTGEIATDAVLSDLTVTMAFPKRGMLSANGLRKCGELRCIDIGIDSQAPHSAEVAGEALFARDIAALLKRRPSDGHKGTFGTTLTIGGSRQFVGAPVLSGTAALRSGCGLSTVLIPDGIRQFISAAPQALIFIPVPDKGEGILNDAGRNTLKEALNATDSIVLGPGIGRAAETAEALAAVLATEKPLLIDADALRLTAGKKEEIKKVQNLILTPHPGEMQV